MTADKIQRFEALVAKEPDNPLHNFALATAYLGAESWERAERAYAHCLELDEAWMVAHIKRGRCLVELGRWDEARASLERAADLATAQGHDEPFEEIRELLDELPD